VVKAKLGVQDEVRKWKDKLFEPIREFCYDAGLRINIKINFVPISLQKQIRKT